ncbi:hypothetical protein GVAV_000378 [Gurleya vavrai]
MSFAIFVFGPAGTGKSTFTKKLYEHGQLTNRTFKRVNLDPGQQTDYEIDITDYITTDLVMEECNLGPNGSLMLALEEFYENIDEIEIESYIDDYLIIDCPGQIELYIHSEVMKNIVMHFNKFFRCCSVYLMEAQYFFDIGKYLSGCLCGLIGLMRLEIQNVNVITKMDLIENRILTSENLEKKDGNKNLGMGNNQDNFDFKILKSLLSKENKFDADLFLCPDENLRENLNVYKGKRKEFYGKILDFLIDNDMVEFQKLNWDDETTIENILYTIDSSLNYFDEIEVKERFK